MNPKLIITVVVVVLVAGLAWVLMPRSAEPAIAPENITVASEDPAEMLQLQRDREEVFKRAFWRRPGADDVILHAERRHWVSTEDENVRRWQWFIEVEPSREFANWLLEENPFDLMEIDDPTQRPDLSTAPDWIPAAADLTTFVAYRKPGADFFVFVDSRNQRIFATDMGGGFNLAAK